HRNRDGDEKGCDAKRQETARHGCERDDQADRSKRRWPPDLCRACRRRGDDVLQDGYQWRRLAEQRRTGGRAQNEEEREAAELIRTDSSSPRSRSADFFVRVPDGIFEGCGTGDCSGAAGG